ncbi:MAG: c-type cytochrome, partial [Terriglobia bacterium]
QLYLSNCSSCHKADLAGSPPEFPSLRNIGNKYSSTEVAEIVRQGSGRMPSFGQLGGPAIHAIAAYLTTGKEIIAKSGWNESTSGPWLKYRIDGYNKFLDPDGYPANKPPWGTLNAINLSTGKFAWRMPFGDYPALAQKGLDDTGCQNFGGPLVTSGGLLFIGATDYDRKFRAFDKATGKLLWKTTLPAAGNATPATYEINGRQFIVIAAGGGEWGAPSGGDYVAFALPQ